MASPLPLRSGDYFAECVDASCEEALIQGGRGSFGVIVDRTHPKCPARWAVRPGLGDMVAAGLSAVGITKARAQAVANAVGVKDCGCAKRQAALNRAGEALGLPPGRAS